MDNLRLVRWFDIRYHEKYPSFSRLIGPKLKSVGDSPKGCVSVWGRRPDGTMNWAVSYERDDNTGSWFINADPASALGSRLRCFASYFEELEDISDEEWGLFEMCEPDLVEWLGKNTLRATSIELMLRGRIKLQVM